MLEKKLAHIKQNNQITYRQLKRRKEFYTIKEIANRLEQKDFAINNPNYKPIHKYNSNGDLISIETGWVKKTFWVDLWYLFDLLEWSRMKRWTL